MFNRTNDIALSTPGTRSDFGIVSLSAAATAAVLLVVRLLVFAGKVFLRVQCLNEVPVRDGDGVLAVPDSKPVINTGQQKRKRKMKGAHVAHSFP
jgi:hypothetical protein